MPCTATARRPGEAPAGLLVARSRARPRQPLPHASRALPGPSSSPSRARRAGCRAGRRSRPRCRPSGVEAQHARRALPPLRHQLDVDLALRAAGVHARSGTTMLLERVGHHGHPRPSCVRCSRAHSHRRPPERQRASASSMPLPARSLRALPRGSSFSWASRSLRMPSSSRARLVKVSRAPSPPSSASSTRCRRISVSFSLASNFRQLAARCGAAVATVEALAGSPCRCCSSS